MTDQELQAAEASRTDWYARAEARGVTADHVRSGVELDTWAALNPSTNWAANEDRARTEHHDHAEWLEKYGTTGSLKREETKMTWASENRATNTKVQAVARAIAAEYRHELEDAGLQLEADNRGADVDRWDAPPATDSADADADVA